MSKNDFEKFAISEGETELQESCDNLENEDLIVFNEIKKNKILSLDEIIQKYVLHIYKLNEGAYSI